MSHSSMLRNSVSVCCEAKVAISHDCLVKFKLLVRLTVFLAVAAELMVQLVTLSQIPYPLSQEKFGP